MSEQEQNELMPVPEAVSRPAVGAQLRAAREARGIQLHEMAATLKLGVRQVDALEKGDWQALPGHTFVRGFVRNYARLVELDPAPLMAQLDGILQKPVSKLESVEASPTVMPNTGPGISRRDRTFMLSGLLAVLVAGVVYVALPSDLSELHGSVQALIDSISGKEDVPPAETATEPVFPPDTSPQQVINPQAETVPPTSETTPASAPPAAPAAPAAAPVAPAAAETAPVVNAPLRFVLEKESWIEVRDRDNKSIFSTKAQPGSEHLVSGNGPFSLVIGYAPGVKLYWRGQLIDLQPHTRSDVARLVLE